MMYLVLLVLRDILFAWNQCAILVSSELARAIRRSSEEQAVQEIGGISRLALKGQSHEKIMNRRSSEEQAVQEIGGISRLALKGLYRERMGNRSSSKKVETGASAG